MLSPKLLLGILIALAAIGVTLLAFQWWILGGIITALTLALLYLYWRLSQILKISEAMLKQDIPLARKRLEAVKNPEKLNPYSKTYYYFFQGMVEVHSQNFKAARPAFKTALETNRFRSVDERATALLMLAQLDLRQRNTEGAKRYLREARALEPGQEIKDQITMIVKQTRIRL